MTDTIHELLNFDPLATAEKITGRSAANNETGMLGLGLQIERQAALREVLTTHRDVHFSSPLCAYKDLLTDLGFTRVLSLPFIARGYRRTEERHETFQVWWHAADGLLAKFDSYGGTGMNGGKVLFNWRPHDQVSPWGHTSGLGLSGGCTRHGPPEDSELIGAYDFDVREAVRYKLDRLRERGTFVTPWRERPWLWLLHHEDTKTEGYDHAAINAERVAMLPPEVQRAITPT